VIALERADTTRHRAEFVVAGGDPQPWRDDFARAARVARQVGLHDVRLHLPGARQTRDDEDGELSAVAPAGNAPPAAVDRAGAARLTAAARQTGATGVAEETEDGPPRHRWLQEGAILAYETTFEHAPSSRDLVAVYTPLMLATFGPQEADLMKLRVSIYEMCANLVEHGRPRRAPAVFTLGLRFLPGRIEGFLQDGCERFNPAEQPGGSVVQRAARRQPRGYGIAMFLQLLDRFEHEYTAAGNRLLFSKGIEA
jgi:anti-sigma regulatory factor (Ser/Thr protein kinase)